jgi:hypothetical protein
VLIRALSSTAATSTYTAVSVAASISTSITSSASATDCSTYSRNSVTTQYATSGEAASVLCMCVVLIIVYSTGKKQSEHLIIMLYNLLQKQYTC